MLLLLFSEMVERGDNLVNGPAPAGYAFDAGSDVMHPEREDVPDGLGPTPRRPVDFSAFRFPGESFLPSRPLQPPASSASSSASITAAIAPETGHVDSSTTSPPPPPTAAY